MRAASGDILRREALQIVPAKQSSKVGDKQRCCLPVLQRGGRGSQCGDDLVEHHRPQG